MSLYALLLVALGMSMDAFAVALAKGAAVRMPPRKIAATALVFGTVEALTPLAGWVASFGTAVRLTLKNRRAGLW